MTCRQCAFYNPFQISTHTSHARCDDSLKRIDRFHCISTHTSRVGCDTHPVLPTQSGHMISTHTSRVGCDLLIYFFELVSNISTHTSRVGCDNMDEIAIRDGSISTHTSRVGCERSIFSAYPNNSISTHTSRVGCESNEVRQTTTNTFLLTHPVWDVTLYIVYYSLSIPIYHEMDL